MKKLPTLYGKSSTGKIKQWSVWTEGDTIYVEHGQQGGKMQVKETVCKPRNVGRANETTAEEQAISEAKSKWKKQYDKDYREGLDELPESTLPNLAHKYQDKQKAVLEAIKRCGYVDVLFKLDGVRNTVFRRAGVFFQSRGGKPYPVIKEIADELDAEWLGGDGIVDGELYCHGMHLEDITSAVKKHNEDTHKIEFHVFDYISETYPNRKWEDRYSIYKTKGDLVEGKRVKTVEAHRCRSIEEIESLHDVAVGLGYEGIVIRIPDGINVFGQRTIDFIKYKERKDAEFKVIRFGVDKNGCAIPWCEVEVDGKMEEFKAPLTGTREYCQSVWENQEDYVGLWLKVEFENYSKYGIPAKPKGVMFRECDDEGNPME